jgi:hypothetical protein
MTAAGSVNMLMPSGLLVPKPLEPATPLWAEFPPVYFAAKTAFSAVEEDEPGGVTSPNAWHPVQLPSL